MSGEAFRFEADSSEPNMKEARMPALRSVSMAVSLAAVLAAPLLLFAGPIAPARAQDADPGASQAGQPQAANPNRRQPTRASIEQALQERGLKKPPPQEQARPAPSPGARMQDPELESLAEQILKLSKSEPLERNPR
jgi:hypothetical protein